MTFLPYNGKDQGDTLLPILPYHLWQIGELVLGYQSMRAGPAPHLMVLHSGKQALHLTWAAQ